MHLSFLGSATVVHGDPAAELAIEPKIKNLGFVTKIPTWREKVTLD